MHRPSLTWEQVKAEFQRLFGYSEFRPPQGEIVRCLLNRQDALVIMPTGGGKSICFQLPALLNQGLTIVVSPLVALMENQVQELRQRRLAAALLHSELPSYERRQVLAAIEQQRLRLLYLSPETLLSPPVWQRLCSPQVQINALILDEAHCLVQWGDSFRPAYRRLGAVRQALLQTKPAGTKIAIAAFTATADPAAQQTIQQVLELQKPQIFLQSPYRSNLHLSVQMTWTPQDRRRRLVRFIRQHAGQSGLVYVRTRRDGETLATWLGKQGYSTAAYHAGLSPEDRRTIEAQWLSGDLQFVVCTNAFGMGVNKPNVKFVIHFHAPNLLSEYIQEVGRAGRDGKPAKALTLISEPTGWLDPTDKQRRQFFQQQQQQQQQKARQLLKQIPSEGEVNAIDRQFQNGALALALLHSQGQLEWQDPFRYVLRSGQHSPLQQSAAAQQMSRFLSMRRCRWQFLLNAFGFDAKNTLNHRACGHCDRCRQGRSRP